MSLSVDILNFLQRLLDLRFLLPSNIVYRAVQRTCYWCFRHFLSFMITWLSFLLIKLRWINTSGGASVVSPGLHSVGFYLSKLGRSLSFLLLFGEFSRQQVMINRMPTTCNIFKWFLLCLLNVFCLVFQGWLYNVFDSLAIFENMSRCLCSQTLILTSLVLQSQRLMFVY